MRKTSAQSVRKMSITGGLYPATYEVFLGLSTTLPVLLLVAHKFSAAFSRLMRSLSLGYLGLIHPFHRAYNENYYSNNYIGVVL